MVDILTAFLPVVGEHYGVSPAHVGVLLAVRGAGSLLSRALLPLLRRRWSREGLVRTALLFSAAAIGVAPLGLAEPTWGGGWPSSRWRRAGSPWGWGSR